MLSAVTETEIVIVTECRNGRKRKRWKSMSDLAFDNLYVSVKGGREGLREGGNQNVQGKTGGAKEKGGEGKGTNGRR